MCIRDRCPVAVLVHPVGTCKVGVPVHCQRTEIVAYLRFEYMEIKITDSFSVPAFAKVTVNPQMCIRDRY